MTDRSKATSIDEYMTEFPEETRKALREVRETIAAAVPDAAETISYAIPTFDLHGRHLIHFAGFAKHVGLYPVIGGLADAFEEELKPFKRGKGSVQFPLDKPMPLDLISHMVRFRARESGAEAARKRGVTRQ
jgi:uncharacterized protein YdhG (YjbR/CyaY superfamily)